jgi:hypothetical protein
MEHVSLQHKIRGRLLIFCHCPFHMYEDDGAVSKETDNCFWHIWNVFIVCFSISYCTSLIYRVLTICILSWRVELITHLLWRLPTFILWLALLCYIVWFVWATNQKLCILTNFSVVICFRQSLGLNWNLSWVVHCTTKVCCVCACSGGRQVVLITTTFQPWTYSWPP